MRIFTVTFCLLAGTLTAGAQKGGIEAGAITIDEQGAIVRGDVSKKVIALVFTGDEFADGGTVIRKTLSRKKISASFFLTGNFYANPKFKSLILGLKEDGHYLGAHSDKHLLYADWIKRDSLLVTERDFKFDLQNNYKRMDALGIKSVDAPYFLPPYEWYNSVIVQWTRQLDLKLVNYSPGTRSTADYTYPDMAARYVSSDAVYSSIMDFESTEPHGLNGFILLIHIGTDARRTDKFYNRLDELLTALTKKGYSFVRIDKLIPK